MKSNSNENKRDQDNLQTLIDSNETSIRIQNKTKLIHVNEDDDNLIYLGSINPENTSPDPETDPVTCHYILMLSRSYLSMAHFHDT